MEAAEDGKPSRKRHWASLDETAAIRSARKPRNAAVAIGSYVRKNFPGDGAGVPFTPLLGKVLSCCGRQYSVVFEDGRRESLNLPETRQILLAAQGLDDSDEILSSKRRLEQLCCSVVKNVPRTRSRMGRADAELATGGETWVENGDAPCNVSKQEEAVVGEGTDTVEVASSSSVPISNLDEADSCSDSCESTQPHELELVQVDAAPEVQPPPLPSSSGDVDVPEDAVSYLFNVYSFLRSFSHQLFLSPFGLDEFVSSLNCTIHNNLLDAVHISLLRTLKRHLDVLESDGSKLASTCLKSIDWNLLDTMTWPVFLVQYFSAVGHMKQVDKKVLLSGSLEGEYCSLPVALKLSVLQILCDDVLDSVELRTELATRENMDEERECDANSITSLLESGPKRVHPRYSKTSACKNPGSLEETIVSNETNSRCKGAESDTKDSNIGQDGNSDDCRLCGMEGTLVCCDGCPSAYHSRCICLNKASLPEGPWFCPECTVKKMGPTSSKVSFGIRGAELFGSDPFGRMFLGICDYLLVLQDSAGGNHDSRYYNRSDVTFVLQVLCSTTQSYSYACICKAISKYWEIPLALDLLPQCGDRDALIHYSNHQNTKVNGEMEVQESGRVTLKEEKREHSFQDESNVVITNDIPILMDANSPGPSFKDASSGRSLEVVDKKFFSLQHEVFEDTCIVGRNNHHLWDESSKSGTLSSFTTDTHARENKGIEGGLTYSPSVYKPYAYINQYIPGEIAASAAANFAIAAAERSKILETNPSAKERKNMAPIATLQLKAFSEASMHFVWPSTDKKIIDVPRERCGWCLACEAAATCKKGCLLNIAVINTVRGYSKSLGNFRPLESGSPISSIAAYILYMEASLNGLLEGPFLDAYHNVQWRKYVAEASTFRVLKYFLLEFEKNIRGVAFLNEWLKPVDTWSSEDSNIQIGASFSASSQKRSLRGRRGRKRSAVSESNSSDCDINSDRIQWWFGGKLSKVVLRRGALPSLLARKAARQGGSREISGVDYNLKNSGITRQAAWRAAVEKIRNYSQLAFQVRYLDAHLRWRDLSPPEPTLLDGKLIDGETYAFRNASIVDENVVKGQTQYALAFGDQKHLPSRILKNILETEPYVNGEKLWFSEKFVPLYLIKDYKERKAALGMPSLNKGNNIYPKMQHNIVRENIFSYLFNRGERPEKSSCSSCKADVLSRHAFKCQNCGGSCHRNCLRAAPIDMKGYMCSTCHNSNSLRKDPAGSSKTSITISKCQIPSQQNCATPETKIRIRISLNSAKQPSNTEEHSENRLVSANATSQKNKCAYNGLIFKGRKASESCDPDFRLKHIILKGDVEMGTSIDPRCKLCSLPYNPNLMYIRCEKCTFWYHAESVQLEEHQVVDLLGFKCPTCRRRCSPICPYANPNSKRRKMKRNDTDGKQCRLAQTTSRTSSEPPETVDVEHFAEPKLEDMVVPPERVEQESTLMLEAPFSWAPKAVATSKGKLPVRRHACNDIATDANSERSELLEEPPMLPTVKEEMKQEVDLGGFSYIQEPDPAIDIGAPCFKFESDFTTNGNMVMDFNKNYEILDPTDAGSEDMEYEPQTYFSFTELIASPRIEPEDDQLDDTFNVDIPVELPDDWNPTDPSGFSDSFDVAQVLPPGHTEMDEVPAIDGLECQKCSSNLPLPDLSCEICGLTIHSHCSPWVEIQESEYDGRWRCGGCREWR